MFNLFNKSNPSFTDQLIVAAINSDRFKLNNVLRDTSDIFGINNADISKILRESSEGNVNLVLSLLDEENYLIIDKEEVLTISSVNRVIKVNALLNYVLAKKDTNGPYHVVNKSHDDHAFISLTDSLYHHFLYNGQTDMGDFLVNISHHFELGKSNVANLSPQYSPQVKSSIINYMLHKSVNYDPILVNTEKAAPVARTRI